MEPRGRWTRTAEPLYRSLDAAIARAAAASRVRVANMFAAFNRGSIRAQKTRLMAAAGYPRNP